MVAVLEDLVIPQRLMQPCADRTLGRQKKKFGLPQVPPWCSARSIYLQPPPAFAPTPSMRRSGWSHRGPRDSPKAYAPNNLGECPVHRCPVRRCKNRRTGVYSTKWRPLLWSPVIIYIPFEVSRVQLRRRCRYCTLRGCYKEGSRGPLS
jgi:hypothetical protein